MAHAMALLLKKKLGATAFAAITFRQAPEGQYCKIVAKDLFSSVLSETEMHQQASNTTVRPDFVSTLESRYRLPFWQYVTQNRFIFMTRPNYAPTFGTHFSREQLLAHVQVRFEMIEAFVDAFKPDIVIFPVDVGPSSALVLERVAKDKNIPVFVPISAKIGSYHTFVDTVFSKARNIERRFAELQQGSSSYSHEEAKELITKFRQGQVRLSYMQEVKLGDYQKMFDIKASFNKVKSIVARRLKHGIFRRKFGDPYNVSQLEYDFDRTLRYYRIWRLKLGKLLEPTLPNEKFVFFPLHIVPELSLLLYAPFHINQETIAQNIAQSLPWDTCLYVKEHPQGIGYKTMSFYKGVKRTPNVRFIYPHLSSRTLAAASQGVVTITGTAGLEAMLLGKPVITLGDVFYNFVPKLVTRASSVEDLPRLVRAFETFETDESILLNVVTAILDESVNVDQEFLAKALFPKSLHEKLNDPELLTYTDFLCKKIQERFNELSAPPQVA
jgi:hypothetical protein